MIEGLRLKFTCQELIDHIDSVIERDHSAIDVAPKPDKDIYTKRIHKMEVIRSRLKNDDYLLSLDDLKQLGIL